VNAGAYGQAEEGGLRLRRSDHERDHDHDHDHDHDRDRDHDLDLDLDRDRSCLRLHARARKNRAGVRTLRGPQRPPSRFFRWGGHGAANMNDNLLPFQKLDVYVASRQLARQVHEAQIRDAELRDQATRASKSTFLGLCEGLPSDSAGVRRRHFEIANNSLHEVIGAVDLASVIGVVEAQAASEILALACRIKSMIRRLPR